MAGLTINRRMRIGSWSAVAAWLCCAAAPQQAADERDQVAPRGFAIPETRQARALADRASAHADAKRWGEAIADWQELLVEHRGDVLRESELERASQQPVHRGAADLARERLLALPAAARTLYRERYQVEAAAALERARRAVDRRALSEVARRFPLCDAARDAWWTLGDVELELGNLEAARAAWQRAQLLAAELGQEPGESARARLAFAAKAEPEEAPLASSVPSEDSPSWRRRFDDGAHRTPFNIDQRWPDPYSIVPCLAGDTVLVCDTLRVFAYDAWSGNLRWSSLEPPGWDAVDDKRVRPDGLKELKREDFFKGVDRRALLSQPAAAAGVAVAALQIPVSHVYNTDFQNFQITTVIPDRRLFAFDLETGRELWNHLPPPLWDGESGSFAERMRIAGPPVIAGSRVVVPAYRMQGRVDLHVACFDLFSGALLWSTALISGQLELNMFGRQHREYCAAPARIVGERVLVVTQLGAVAALDLATGDILWETLYEQIAVPHNDRSMQQEREQRWNNTPAQVAHTEAGSVVVATPIDSSDLLGFELEHGALLWSTPVSRFHRLRTDARLTLVAASADGVVLAGTKVFVARSPRGLLDPAGPTEISESNDLSEGRALLPRPAVTEHHIVVPAPTRRVTLDRLALKREDALSSADWGDEQTPGNALAAEGVVFFATYRFLTACVDFPAIERRYRLRAEADPRDVGAALEYAQLLARRGQTTLQTPRVREALELLERARAVLEPLAGAPGVNPDSRVAAELFATLYLEARGWVRAADRPRAIERLRRARAVAPDSVSACRALVASCELLADERETDARLATLDELAADFGELPMPDDWWNERGRVLFSGSAVEGSASTPVAVGLWVAVERAHEYARRTDVAGQLQVLHEIVARYDDAPVPSDASAGSRLPPTRASALIQQILDAVGREPYAPFERAARAMLDNARAANDQALLERLARDYPHSDAAREAIDARLKVALAEGDASSVAQIALRRIPDDWVPARARPEQVEGLLALGAAFEARGNAELRRSLLASLARHHGTLVSPLESDRGATLETLVRAAGAREADGEPLPATFVANPQRTLTLPGQYSFSGRVAGAPAEELLVFVRRGQRQDLLTAFDAASPEEPRWSLELERGAIQEGWRVECCSGSLLIAGRESVTAVEAQSGALRWVWRGESERVESVVGAGGIALVSLRSSEGRARLLAIDAAGGIELWTRALPREIWALPIAGDDAVVLLPADYAATPARVLDLFTGSHVIDFTLPEHVGENDLESAWIVGRRLILPSFPKSSAGEARDCVAAFDLDSGKRAWRVAGDELCSFDSIVRRGDDTYLIFLGGTDAARTGYIQELDTELGAVRKLQNVAIGAGDVLIGVPRHAAVRWSGPYLIVRSSAPGETETWLRAIHLPYGERWLHRLGIAPAQFYNQGPMPAHALSQTSLALVYTAAPRKGTGNLPAQTTLLALNRDNGLLQSSRSLPRELGSADGIELAALGSALWIAGREALLITY